MRMAVLGAVRVDGGAAMRPRSRAVLAALAVHRDRAVAPDELAEALWGDDPPRSWPKQVQYCIWDVRRALGAEAVLTVDGGYQLAIDDLDAVEFERLVDRGQALAATGDADRAASTLDRALGLWRGRPFEELDGWLPARTEAARLDEVRRTAAEDLLEAQLAAGHHRDAVAVADRLVAEEPLRERRWGQLALAQYRSGNQADALRSLRRARQTLVEQLGIEPGPDLVALERAILEQDPTLDRPASPPTTGRCPYQGLAVYDDDDADLFFGRDAEIAAALERLDAVRLLVVAGPSGSGKSSLVRAGVVPALRRRGRSVAILVPGTDPDAALTHAIATAGPDAIVVIDQMEEVFVGRHPHAVVRSFAERLAMFAAEQAPVILTVRSDHLGTLAAQPALARLVEKGLFLVGPPSGDALRATIEGPAAAAGLRLEAGLVDLLVRETEGEPAALPLLSHALAETWARRDGRVLTVDGYRATGEIRGAVARSAEQLWGSLSPDEQARLRAVLLRLVVPVPNGEPVRAHLDRRHLDADADRAHVLDLLVRARLVTADESTVELAHEAAARAWPRLRRWLEEDAAGQRLMHHLASAAEEWERLGRPSSELYRGARLEAALEWRANNETDLTELERTFLAESAAAADSERHRLADQARRQARQNKRLRWALAAAAVLLVAAVAGGLVAVSQRQEAQDQRHQADEQRQEADVQRREADEQRLEAERQREQADEQRLEAERQREQADEQRLEAERQREQADEQRLEADVQRREAAISALVGDATVLRSNRRDLAALLAVEAYRLRPDAESESALFGTFTAAPGAVQVVPTGRSLSVLGADAAFLADGRTVVFGDDFGAIHSVDLDTGAIESLPALSDKPGYPVWAVAGDGRSVVAGWREFSEPETGLFTVWDLESGERRFEPVTVPFRFGDLAINGDGSIVAVGGGMQMRALTFDGVTGEQLAEAERLERPPDASNRVATAALRFAPDGRLAVGSQAGVLRLIDPRTGEERQRFVGPQESSFAEIEFLDDGRDILAAGGPIVRYDLATGAERWPSRPPIGQCNSYAVAELIGALLCGQWSGRVIVFDLETGAELGPRFDSQQGDVCGLAVSPDGTRLVEVTSCQGHNVTLVEWRLDGGGPISQPVVSTTGERYVAGYGFDGPDALVVEFADGQDAPLRTHVLDPSGASRDQFDDVWAFFPTEDESIAAVIYDDLVNPLAIGLYDTRQRAPAGPVIDPGIDFTDFWTDGRIAVLLKEIGPPEAAAGERNELRTYELATGRLMEPRGSWPLGASILHVAFDAEAIYMLRIDQTGEREVRFVQRIDRASGAVVAESDRAALYWSLAANGGVLAAATTDGHVVELDAVTLEPRGAPFPGTNGPVGTLAIDESGTRLMVRADDDSLRFYDIPTRTQLGEPIDTDVPFAGAALRADGLAAAAVTAHGITTYDLDPANWVDAACRLAGRNLTREEWDRYLGDLADYRPTCPEHPLP